VSLHASRTEQRIVLAGELDYNGARHLASVIEETLATRAARLVLDLSQLSFIDSSGVRAVLNASLDATQAGTELLVIPGIDAVQRRFELAGLQTLLPFTSANQPGPRLPR
jgi:anti-anti-sigma factor